MKKAALLTLVRRKELIRVRLSHATHACEPVAEQPFSR
jgi:hypothetical protein